MNENYTHPKKLEWQQKESERLRKILENRTPYDPLQDPILQGELREEARKRAINDKITETYNRKKREGKLHELTNITYDGEKNIYLTKDD